MYLYIFIFYIHDCLKHIEPNVPENREWSDVWKDPIIPVVGSRGNT